MIITWFSYYRQIRFITEKWGNYFINWSCQFSKSRIVFPKSGEPSSNVKYVKWQSNLFLKVVDLMENIFIINFAQLRTKNNNVNNNFNNNKVIKFPGPVLIGLYEWLWLYTWYTMIMIITLNYSVACSTYPHKIMLGYWYVGYKVIISCVL